MVDKVDMPTLPPDRHQLTMIANQMVQASPYTGAQSVLTWGGSELWGYDLTYSGLNNDDRADFLGFLAALRGARNYAEIPIIGAPQRGALSGTIVATSYSTGQWLVADSTVGAVSSWARRGDFCTVNCEVKVVLADTGTTAGGIASLQVWPPLRNFGSFYASQAIIVNTPYGMFTMRGAGDIKFNTTPPGFRSDFIVKFIERINSSMVSNL